MKNVFSHLFSGWRLWVVLLGFALIGIGGIIGPAAPVRHSSDPDIAATGDAQRKTGGKMLIAGVIIIASMFVYGMVNSKNEKGTEFDKKYN